MRRTHSLYESDRTRTILMTRRAAFRGGSNTYLTSRRKIAEMTSTEISRSRVVRQGALLLDGGVVRFHIPACVTAAPEQSPIVAHRTMTRAMSKSFGLCRDFGGDSSRFSTGYNHHRTTPPEFSYIAGCSFALVLALQMLLTTLKGKANLQWRTQCVPS